MVQMKHFLLFLLIPILSGCFEDEPKLPQFYAKQEIDVAVDSVICYSNQEDFDYFILTCSVPFDSVHWYLNYYNPTFLGSKDTLILPNNPFGYEVIRCFGFNGIDTTEFQLRVVYCPRYMYIPIAFSPNDDGLNDKWYPVYYTTDYAALYQPYSIHWEIRTLEGIKVFETDDAEKRWDGTYNDHNLPNGAYLYYIELTISGEDPVVYTGWLELIQ
ncbi:MAG: gliding motility-associated C-terminal domain-containing protein [Flavobacteriales bacterium]|nr:gliding motility-associated C-terminal domain-containing protein [Flavobacteriales bacterium]